MVRLSLSTKYKALICQSHLPLILTLQINTGVTRNWFDARVECQREGGELVSINSPDEQAFIESKFAVFYYINQNFLFIQLLSNASVIGTFNRLLLMLLQIK